MASREMEESPNLARWWTEDTVVVVTGANRGIGYAFAKRFAELGMTVILTARDESSGLKAANSLRRLGFLVQFSRLDVADNNSIRNFADWLRRKFGVLDILVNNAGVSFNDMGENSVEHAQTVMKTNFYGPKLLIQTLLPLFRRSKSISRILNITSSLGALDLVRNPDIRELLQDVNNLSEEKIERTAALFLDQVNDGTWIDHGWPEIWTDYSVSKLLLNAYSRLLAKRYVGAGLSVNCYCPGYTKTGMTRGRGRHTPEMAVEIGIRHVLVLPEEITTGKLYTSGKNSLLSSL